MECPVFKTWTEYSGAKSVESSRVSWPTFPPVMIVMREQKDDVRYMTALQGALQNSASDGGATGTHAEE